MSAIILRRNRHRGVWSLRFVNVGDIAILTLEDPAVLHNAIAAAIGEPTRDVDTHHAATERAGDVAHAIARKYPGYRIGIASEEVGPACVALGPVVWMRKGFELQH